MEPEVQVRTLRRRRKPSTPQSPQPVNLRNLAVYAGVAVLTAVLMLDGYLRHRPRDQLLPSRSEATGVRSAISQPGESLQVVVSWDLTLSEPGGRPASIRVTVLPQQQPDSLVSVQAANQFSDTLYLGAPAPGQTVAGTSCVTAQHEGDSEGMESCTPWQYVRPTAAPSPASAVVAGIVIQPSGLQVDPDVDGKCAEWQAANPGRSVWISVNRKAVPACTGPNARPTVAQFCAFAVLPDGRRVKTANSANNSYCDELFEEWIRERYS